MDTDLLMELLEDISPGDYVKISYGIGTPQTDVGQVLAMSKLSIKLESDDGIQRIRLDSIVSIKQLKVPPAPTVPAPVAVAPVVQAVVQEPALPPLLEETPPTFIVPIHLKALKASFKSCPHKDIRNGANAIVDSLENAIKCKDVPSKIHNLKARTQSLLPQCETVEDLELYDRLLSTLLLIDKSYEQAMDSLLRLKRYDLAAYAAYAMGNHDCYGLYRICMLLSDATSSMPDKTVCNICIERTTICPLDTILHQNGHNDTLCQHILACAATIWNRVLSTTPLPRRGDASAAAYARTILDALPASWRDDTSLIQSWHDFQSFAYVLPEKEPDPDQDQVTTIAWFAADKNFGALTEDNLFFHVAQVKEEDYLLRTALANNQTLGIEVSYLLGSNNRGKAATDISLTPQGRKDLEARLQAPQPTAEPPITGDVIDFNNFSQFGRILSNGVIYNFILASIEDPWLRGFFENCPSQCDQRVTFTPGQRGQKKTAQNIQRSTPFTPEEQAYFAHLVSKDDVAHWEQCQQGLTPEPEDSADLESPYERFPFVSLPPYTPPAPSMPVSTVAPVAPKPVTQTAPPQPRIPASYPPTTAFVSGDVDTPLYNKAHLLLLHQNLPGAEAAYLQAIQAGERLESSVADLIGIYLRQESRYDDAIALLKQYEHQLNPSKSLNLEITICLKSKDYPRLIELYNKAFQRSDKPSAKAHFLVNIATAQRAIQKHQESLDTYKRWRTLASQYRNTQEGSKMEHFLPAIQRGEAVCYYFLGQQDKADELAKGLLRLNPDDEAANSILQRTLFQDPSSSSEVVIAEPLVADEEERDATLNAYVQYRIQEVNISSILPSEYVKNGVYTASIAQGEREMEKLLARQRGNTAQHRSDFLFSAARLVDLMPDGTKRPANLSERSLKLYAGRAMATWGDYTLTTSTAQLDTTRFAYLTALEILGPTEQYWTDAFNRYLRSYFQGIIALRDYVLNQSKSNVKDGISTSFLQSQTLQTALYPEFLMGMLLMYRAIPTRRRNELVNALFSSQQLRDGLCNQMEKLLDESDAKAPTHLASFTALLERSSRKLLARHHELDALLDNCTQSLLATQEQEKNLGLLHHPQWRLCLNTTDYSRLERLIELLQRTQEYIHSNVFSHRASCFNDAINAIDELSEAIHKEPTGISFDLYLPKLDVMRSKLNDERQTLYSQFIPELTWSVNINPYLSTGQQFRFHLTARNERNCQSPDSLQIEDISGQGLCNCTTMPPARGQSDSDVMEVIFKGELTADALDAGSFTLTFSYSYRYRNAAQEYVYQKQEEQLVLIIQGDRKSALKNPFRPHIGHEMSDAHMFYGRDDEIAHIVNMICPPDNALPQYGHGIALYGQTRTGKSSILYHLKKQLKTRYPTRVLLWSIDNIGELSINSDFILSFFDTILRTVEQSLEDHPALLAAVEDQGLENPKELIWSDPARAPLRFSSYMNRLSRIIRTQPNGMIAVLLIDEFSYLNGFIQEGTVPEAFMKYWKAFLQNYGVFAVVAGQDDMPGFIRKYQNEFACMDLKKVTALKEVYAKKLMQEPLERENHADNLFLPREETLQKLYRLTAGSAYLTILLCAELVDVMNERGAPVMTPAIIDDALDSSILKGQSCLNEAAFEPQLKERGRPDLDAINQWLLLSIARQCQRSEYTSVQNLYSEPYTCEEIDAALTRLVDRNVLICENQSRYRIDVNLLERWLLATRGGR